MEYHVKTTLLGNREKYVAVNTWILRNMHLYYFWEYLLPDDVNGEINPTRYFESLLKPDDIFSFISDDAQALLDDLAGNSITAGYSPAFGLIRGTDKVFIVVEYVTPNTPAKEAGMKRGDIILDINQAGLDTLNYLDLFYAKGTSTYTMGKAEYDEAQERYLLSENGVTLTITKDDEPIPLDPVVHTSTIDTSTHKIGYLFYSNFVTGETNEFITSLNNALSELESQGITDLVVDLRYNPGGSISSAKNFANALVPFSNAQNEDIFISFEYNDGLEQHFLERDGPDSPELLSRFSVSEVNLDLERIYFITTNSSASASELIINGLEPYMDVYRIGENTFGKFYGSFVLSGLNASPTNNYAIAPVTLKYANALGFTDFRNGLEPNFSVSENIFETVSLGDIKDPFLSVAIEHIVNGRVLAKALPVSLPYKILKDPIELGKGNIIFQK